ncbi:YkvA family protein [Gaoshiqia sediminis]|uniref:DUF1232 domain-containing protein n=1 Tax=Gaoshiqia sediminis TaxID=2986998 RepID=A0AA42C8S1_9BACT|nr:YkvA family protein [Gaoshiqia sediminis]MCW0485044.1 DUF1232 domain-containing protein [Gaoshiqia sediminis]
MTIVTLINTENHITTINKLKKWANRIKTDLKALRIALTDNLVPWYVQALIILTVGYAFSPIDLIPDFIPILGLLDDIVIVPLLIYVTIKLISTEVMQYCRLQAETREFKKKKNWIVGSIIILLWVILVVWIFKMFITSSKW